MLKKDAIAHFGSLSGVVKALEGRRHRSAIYQWGRVVPLLAAFELQEITDGKLRVDTSLYPEIGQHIKTELTA